MDLGLSGSEIKKGGIIFLIIKKKKKEKKEERRRRRRLPSYGKRQIFNVPKANAIDFKGERQIFNWLEKIAAKLCL